MKKKIRRRAKRYCRTHRWEILQDPYTRERIAMNMSIEYNIEGRFMHKYILQSNTAIEIRLQKHRMVGGGSLAGNRNVPLPVIFKTVNSISLSTILYAYI